MTLDKLLHFSRLKFLHLYVEKTQFPYVKTLPSNWRMRLEDLWLCDKNLILTLRGAHSGWGVLKEVEASQLGKTRRGSVEELVFR